MLDHRSSINLVWVTKEQNWEFSLFFSTVVRQNNPSITAFDNSKRGGNSNLSNGYQNKRRGTKHFHERHALPWPSHPYSTMIEKKTIKFLQKGILNVVGFIIFYFFFLHVEIVSNKIAKEVFTQLQVQLTAYEMP